MRLKLIKQPRIYQKEITDMLNESLLLNGGHIGDGVRPSERRKGIATKMIALALEECRALQKALFITAASWKMKCW